MRIYGVLVAAFVLALALLVGLPGGAVHAAPGASDSAQSNVKIYVVKEGDTLGIIARKFGVSIADIQKANKLDAGVIYVGQKLRIPVKAAPVKKQSQARNQSNKRPTRSNGFRPPNARKWIEVDLSQQRLYAYENGKMVFTTLISSGRSPYRTPIGRFRVWLKVRRQTMSGPGYRLPNVQWVMYFAGENAIHGTYWHNNFGRPMSHGCVNATNQAAKWLYNWAPKGTLVVVHR